ncbi:carbonic anhydrase family protein, partial [Pseudomonas lundensis]|uniref:carbonic anhydrase family protein n=1 Tax=Pseudomonas lundensis TaxID=86185 RepID=UPI003F973F37
ANYDLRPPRSKLIGASLGVMPRHKGDAYVLGQLNVERFMPAQRHYYTYRAGLPVPPCTEKVRWHILKTPVEVSEEQIVAFQLMFPIDPRPVQPVIKHTVRVSG